MNKALCMYHQVPTASTQGYLIDLCFVAIEVANANEFLLIDGKEGNAGCPTGQQSSYSTSPSAGKTCRYKQKIFQAVTVRRRCEIKKAGARLNCRHVATCLRTSISVGVFSVFSMSSVSFPSMISCNPPRQHRSLSFFVIWCFTISIRISRTPFDSRPFSCLRLGISQEFLLSTAMRKRKDERFLRLCRQRSVCPISERNLLDAADTLSRKLAPLFLSSLSFGLSTMRCDPLHSLPSRGGSNSF